MNIKQLNEAIARCNPYEQKTKLRHLHKQKRQLLKSINQSVVDVTTGNLPAMLQKQSGL